MGWSCVFDAELERRQREALAAAGDAAGETAAADQAGALLIGPDDKEGGGDPDGGLRTPLLI